MREPPAAERGLDALSPDEIEKEIRRASERASPEEMRERLAERDAR